MKKRIIDLLPIVFIFIFVGVFFRQTFLLGKLPVPSDTLVGMYHPWLDFIAKVYPGGMPFKNFLITDPIRQQIPWRKQVIDAYKNKKLPLWDATSFSGTPLLANIQSGALYPLNVLFFILPFSTAWTILIISQPLLVGIFLFLFLRHKQLDPISSLAGAVCFAFSGFSIAWLTWGTMVSTILWLPLSLLSLEKIHQSSKKTPWRLLFVFSLVSSFFAGHIQIFAYCMLVFGAYVIWMQRSVKMNKLYLMHVVIPVVVLAITAPVWFRFVSYLPDTSRIAGSVATGEGFFIPLPHLIQFIAPDFFGNPATLNYWGTWNYAEMVGYIGVVGLFFAILGISMKTVFWVGVVVLSLLFAVDSPISRLPFILHIPVFSSLQPTRLLAIIDMCISILAAYGMATLVAGERKKQIFVAGIVLLIVFVGAWISVLVPASFGIPIEHITVVKRNLMLPSVLFVVAMGMVGGVMIFKKSRITLRYIGAFILLILLSFELIRFGWKFTPFTDPALFFPKTQIISYLQDQEKPYRITTLDDRIMPPNVNSYYGIESIAGYDPLYNSRYEKFISAMERGEPNITPPYGFNRIMNPKNIASPLFRLLGVRYVLSLTDITDVRFKKVMQEGQTRVYEYTDFLPRVYLLDQIEVIQDETKIIETLYSPAFQAGKYGIVEDQVYVGQEPVSDGEKADIISYADNTVDISVRTNTARLLFIGNMFHRNWKAYVDGKKVSVLRVNYIFIGVVIPAGEHIVQLRYE